MRQLYRLLYNYKISQFRLHDLYSVKSHIRTHLHDSLFVYFIARYQNNYIILNISLFGFSLIIFYICTMLPAENDLFNIPVNASNCISSILFQDTVIKP